ncbi:MAG TPA: hypothetical protein VN414_03105 [Methanosarcina sp.]|nr:hypothetical protein [Methanosarcina sp.]
MLKRELVYRKKNPANWRKATFPKESLTKDKRKSNPTDRRKALISQKLGDESEILS